MVILFHYVVVCFDRAGVGTVLASRCWSKGDDTCVGYSKALEEDYKLIKEEYPGDPTLGGPGSDTHYWVRRNTPKARAALVSAPLQRTPSQHTRSQCGVPAWPGVKTVHSQ